MKKVKRYPPIPQTYQRPRPTEKKPLFNYDPITIFLGLLVAALLWCGFYYAIHPTSGDNPKFENIPADTPVADGKTY